MSGNAGARLHANKFEDQIRRRGRIVKWQEASVCSCYNLDSGQPQYDCQACFGLGYTYSTPIEDIALVMSITHDKAFDESAGVFEMGDAIMTVGKYIPVINPKTNIVDASQRGRPNPLFHIGMGDLVTLTDDEYKTSEILIKGTPIYARPADTLLNEDVTGIREVKKSDPITGDIERYELGVNFEMNGNQVRWIEGAIQPAEGEQYSVVYTHRPMFTVTTNLPTPRYQDGQDLPRKVALRYRAGGFDRQ